MTGEAFLSKLNLAAAETERIDRKKKKKRHRK